MSVVSLAIKDIKTIKILHDKKSLTRKCLANLRSRVKPSKGRHAKYDKWSNEKHAKRINAASLLIGNKLLWILLCRFVVFACLEIIFRNDFHQAKMPVLSIALITFMCQKKNSSGDLRCYLNIISVMTFTFAHYLLFGALIVGMRVA